MRIALYITAALLLQTVILPRLNFFGVVPDLLLVSVICLAALQEGFEANLLAGGLGLCQDILSFGLYFNTIFKVIVCNVTTWVKDKFINDERSLVAFMLLTATPIILLGEQGWLYFTAGRELSLFYLIFQLLFTTLYNLGLAWLVFPLIRGLVNGK